MAEDPHVKCILLEAYVAVNEGKEAYEIRSILDRLPSDYAPSQCSKEFTQFINRLHSSNLDDREILEIISKLRHGVFIIAPPHFSRTLRMYMRNISDSVEHEFAHNNLLMFVILPIIVAPVTLIICKLFC